MWKSDPLMWKPLHQAKSEENQGFGGGPGGNRTHIRGFAVPDFLRHGRMAEVFRLAIRNVKNLGEICGS